MKKAKKNKGFPAEQWKKVFEGMTKDIREYGARLDLKEKELKEKTDPLIIEKRNNEEGYAIWLKEYGMNDAYLRGKIGPETVDLLLSINYFAHLYHEPFIREFKGKTFKIKTKEQIEWELTAFLAKYIRADVSRSVKITGEKWDDVFSNYIAKIGHIISKNKYNPDGNNANFLSFVKKAFENLIKDEWKARERRKESMNIIPIEFADSTIDEREMERINKIDSKKVLDMAKEYLNKIHPNYKIIIEEHYLMDKKISEIAQERGIPEQNVRMLLSRAMKSLRKAIGEGKVL